MIEISLDLTVASRVHLLEPQWNPMAEEQALDRVHRLGQSREVVATRYIVKDSIEEVNHKGAPDRRCKNCSNGSSIFCKFKTPNWT